MLLGYKDQFIQKLQSGVKIHTIRAKRKVLIKPGDKLQHYGKVRQRGMFKIIPDNECVRNQEIKIIRHGRNDIKIHVDGREMSIDKEAEFYVNDGFDWWDDFKNFWLNHPKAYKSGEVIFEGVLHHWTNYRY